MARPQKSSQSKEPTIQVKEDAKDIGAAGGTHSETGDPWEVCPSCFLI